VLAARQHLVLFTRIQFLPGVKLNYEGRVDTMPKRTHRNPDVRHNRPWDNQAVASQLEALLTPTISETAISSTGLRDRILYCYSGADNRDQVVYPHCLRVDDDANPRFRCCAIKTNLVQIKQFSRLLRQLAIYVVFPSPQKPSTSAPK